MMKRRTLQMNSKLNFDSVSDCFNEILILILSDSFTDEYTEGSEFADEAEEATEEEEENEKRITNETLPENVTER